ncbi:MAG: glutamine--tRNA ligase/YqeY domain fusion protein [Myxococcota bacterium]
MDHDEAKVGANFLRTIVADDLAAGRHARVVTRFPPEPNGYPHIGHAKSICVNFGLAAEFGGACNLRMDDTDPTKESEEYVTAFQRDVSWLGFSWAGLYYCSDYFQQLHDHAVALIRKGKAYVCGLSDEEIRVYRGTVSEPGRPSPGRERSVEENLDLFARMRAGEFPDGAYTLRARIDMASPNMKMRDPLLYRIRHVRHYHVGDAWCIYPMYDWAHPLSDAIEGVTHSICTLEFENNRELYDWVIRETGVSPRPRQYEMARLAMTYTVMSKRKLLRLVDEGRVDGWDDPRMPTIAGLRRRGVTPEAIRDFCDRVGVARANSVVEYAAFEAAIRDDLNTRAPRMMAVLRPLKVIVESWSGEDEWLDAPLWPHDVPKEGTRKVAFSRELWIERDDFAEEPPKGWHRLAPGREVRLRYGYVVRCVGVEKDAAGNVVAVRCTHDPATRGGNTPDGRKVPGTLHWVSATHATRVTVRLYDRLFSHERPDAGDEDFLVHLNPRSLEVVEAMGEPALAGATGHVQLERVGYFWKEGEGWNRVVGLKESFGKAAPAPARVEKPAAQAPTARREVSAEVLARFPGVGAEEAAVLDADPKLAALFADTCNTCRNPKAAASWIVNELPRDADVSGAALGQLVARIDDGTLSSRLAKDVLAEMIAGGGEPDSIIARKGLVQVSDDGAIAPIVAEVVAGNPDKVEAFRGGRQGLLGFFVGEVMKKSGGKANPKRVQELVRAALGG